MLGIREDVVGIGPLHDRLDIDVVLQNIVEDVDVGGQNPSLG